MRPFIKALKSGSFTLISIRKTCNKEEHTEKAESVKLHVEVLLNLLVETIRSPGLGKETEGDGLTEAVKLESAASTSVHNRGVVNDRDGNVTLLRANPEIRVRGGSIDHA